MTLRETTDAFYRALALSDAGSRAAELPQALAQLAKATASLAPPWLKVEDGSALQFAVELLLEVKREKGNSRQVSEATAQEACERLQTRLKSLPYTYQLRIPLALGPNEAAPEYQLLDGVKLTARRQTPGATLNALFGDGQAWDFGGPALEIELKGYAGAGQSSDFADAASRLVKRAVFSLVTSGVAEIQKSTQLPPHAQQLTNSAGDRLPINILSTEALGLLGHLLPGWAWKVIGLPESSEMSKLARAITNGDAAKWLNTFFRFQSAPEYDRVCMAIDWWGDSHATKNRTHAYIYACIGLEALLGDHTKQRERLTDMLCDRAAFLLGKSDRERQDIAQQVATILRVRGQIMHGKSPALTRSQEASLHDLHLLLARAIRTFIERAVSEMD